MIQCPSCASFNDAEAAFCNQCGRPLEKRRPIGKGNRIVRSLLAVLSILFLSFGALALYRWLASARTEPSAPLAQMAVPAPPKAEPEESAPAEEAAEPQPLPNDAIGRLVDSALVNLDLTDERGEPLRQLRGIAVEPGAVICRFRPLLGTYGATCRIGRGSAAGREVNGLVAYDDYRNVAVLEPRPADGAPLPALAAGAATLLPVGTEVVVASAGKVGRAQVSESPYFGRDGVARVRLAPDPGLPAEPLVALDPYGAVIGLCSVEVEGTPAAGRGEGDDEDVPPRVLVDTIVKVVDYLGRPASLSLADATRRLYEGTFFDLVDRARKALDAQNPAAAIEFLGRAIDGAERERVDADAVQGALDLLGRTLDGEIERKRSEKDAKGLAAILEVAAARFPQSRAYWIELGAARLDSEDPEGAVAALLEARRIQVGADADALLQKAYLAGSSREVSLGRLQVAAEWLEKGISVLPGSARLHFELGKIYQRWNFFEDAVRVYGIARSIDPGLGPEVDAALEEIDRAVKGRQSLVLKIPEGSSVIRAEAVINGRLKFPFVIDTGATFTSLSREMAESLGYRFGPGLETVNIGTANGVVAAPVIILDSVNLHGYAVRNLKAVVLPKAQSQEGLLGLNFLDNFRYSVDPGRREFRLERR